MHRFAVRVCYGFREPARDVMMSKGIETLGARRLRRCDKLIGKAVRNPVFGSRWFPRRPTDQHKLRRRRDILEERATTQRRFNSPIQFYRRRANELGL